MNDPIELLNKAFPDGWVLKYEPVLEKLHGPKWKYQISKLNGGHLAMGDTIASIAKSAIESAMIEAERVERECEGSIQQSQNRYNVLKGLLDQIL